MSDSQDSELQQALEESRKMALGVTESEETDFRKAITDSIDSLPTNQVSPRLTYHLCSIVYHIGQTAKMGHYVAYVQDLATRKWKLYNDSEVEEVYVLEQELSL